MEKMIIVDENDREIGIKDRNGVGDEIYRVAALWVTNSSGQILLAQRSLKKKNSPGRWGPAAAGTVEEGETYKSNILKEAEEEIGLTDFELRPLKKIRVSQEYGKNYFCQYFAAIINRPAEAFVLQKDEVEKVAWFERGYLTNDLQCNPDKYVVSIAQVL